MDVIDLPSILNNQKTMIIAVFILSIISMISIASADVRLQNTYATSGSEILENIYLHGVDYSNTAASIRPLSPPIPQLQWPRTPTAAALKISPT